VSSYPAQLLDAVLDCAGDLGLGRAFNRQVGPAGKRVSDLFDLPLRERSGIRRAVALTHKLAGFAERNFFDDQSDGLANNLLRSRRGAGTALLNDPFGDLSGHEALLLVLDGAVA